MRPVAKFGIVAAGYIAAALIASFAVAIRVANTYALEAQAASGMYAFGDTLLFVAVFGMISLVPTGAALIFLRPYRPFWIGLSVTGVAAAFTGVNAAVLFAVARNATASTLATLAAISVLRILIAPILAFILLVCAIIAPHRTSRVALLAATLMEAGISAYGALIWFLPILAHQ